MLLLRSLALPLFFFFFFILRRRLPLSLSLSLSLSPSTTPTNPQTTNSAATDVEIKDSPPPIEYFETFGDLDKKVAR